MRQIIYTRLLLLTALHFTYGERKIFSIIKKSQNIKNIIVDSLFKPVCSDPGVFKFSLSTYITHYYQLPQFTSLEFPRANNLLGPSI